MDQQLADGDNNHSMEGDIAAKLQIVERRKN